MNKTFILINLGCRVNLFESTAITDQLIGLGFKKVDNLQDAQIVILNTCSVTAKADRKCRNYINRIKKSKTLEVFVVIGCFSQINYDYVKFKADITLGNKHKNNIPKLIEQFYKTKTPIVLVEDLSQERKFEEMNKYSFCENTRAIIKIQDGCDFMCSYCLIPYARGRQRSLNHNLVLSTIAKLAKKGFYEIVLTGVNTAGYNDNGYTFYNLLCDINKLKEKFRVRISSIEPFQISKEIIDLICTNKQRWCQHFHLCLQSANDIVLKEMHRKYTFIFFEKLCEYIRSVNPLVSITTDYIVGYCNESDQLFNDSINNLILIHPDFMNIFPYSLRPKTIDNFKNNIVSEIQKHKRLNQITKLSHLWTNDYLRQFLNKTVEVYFENSKRAKIQCGHSQYFFKVNVFEKNNLHTQVHNVLITKINENNEVFGKII